MTDLSNRRHGRQSATDLVLAKSARMMPEEEGAAGPLCYGHRIRTEQFPKGFTLPRDTPKYNGSVKPEDWLTDYMAAVGIAGSSRHVAVRYAPLMLQGSARTWLNSFPSNNINCWQRFIERFHLQIHWHI